MKKLAVIFPGIGYHADKPLLYYAGKLAAEAGYDEQIKVSYTSTQKKIRGDMDKMKKAFEELYAQAEDALKEIKWDEYDDILFISKSIGTIIAMKYASKNNVNKVRQILYTPLEATFQIASGSSADDVPACNDAIAFIGTADPWSSVPEVIALSQKSGVPIHVYDDANHSLETDDTIENLHIIRDVMKKSKIFII